MSDPGAPNESVRDAIQAVAAQVMAVTQDPNPWMHPAALAAVAVAASDRDLILGGVVGCNGGVFATSRPDGGERPLFLVGSVYGSVEVTDDFTALAALLQGLQLREDLLLDSHSDDPPGG